MKCKHKVFRTEIHVRTAIYSMNTRKGTKYGKVAAEWCRTCKSFRIVRLK